MSKLIAVRLPDGLALALERNSKETGRNASQIVIAGLEMVLYNTAPIGKAVMTELIEDAAAHIAALPQLNGYQRRTLGHALNCKCLICKPPKP